MGIGLIVSLFSSVPENYASDAAPFTIAQSDQVDDVVTYTVTGPKQESTRAAAFTLLGVPWVIGAFVSPFLHFPPPPNAAANAATTTNPIWVSFFLLIVGGLMCRQAYKRQYAASRKYQVAINTQTQAATFSSTRSEDSHDQARPMIQLCKTPDEKFHTVSIISDEHSILLGMLRKREHAMMYVELLHEETGLLRGDATRFKRVPLVYHTSLTKLDSKALDKPVRTKPI